MLLLSAAWVEASMSVRRLSEGDRKICVCWKSITALHLGTSRLGRASSLYQHVSPPLVCVDFLLWVCEMSRTCCCFIRFKVLNDSVLAASRELGQGHGWFLWRGDGLIAQTASVNPPSAFKVF